jgi:DNA-binding PadR family transcriptional regulator
VSDRVGNLTDNEGALLALVLRIQPTTAYQIMRIYNDSPVSNFNTSTGKLYPLIRRLRELGLLEAQAVEGDRRGTEQLWCTPAGEAAIRLWVRQLRPAHLLLEDPMRTKVQSFDLLTREEQVEWIVDAKAALAEKLAEVEAYRGEAQVPYQEVVHDNAVSAIRARMDWLDRMLHRIVKAGSAQARLVARNGN